MSVAGPSAPGHRAPGVQDPCTRCCNKGTPCVLGMAKGKIMACEACCHAKMQKQKQVWRSEEAGDREVIDVDKDEDEDEDKEWSHFAVPTHLAEEHWDSLRALTTTLDMLSMDFLVFWWDSWNLSMFILRAVEAVTDELQRSNVLRPLGLIPVQVPEG
ncbi:hypothetical protein ID866_10773 [Astraeus odoratus]|nr:hypothetical protein ID866_10773 [Astraeus odoratus]